MNGLFLFNDALVITRRMSKNFPFSRAIEYTYKFEVSVALGRMRVHDIPESKCKYQFVINSHSIDKIIGFGKVLKFHAQKFWTKWHMQTVQTQIRLLLQEKVF